MTEVNNCTKAGELHESFSGQNRDTPSSSAKPSTEFVKASQLLGKKSSTSASTSGRNSSLPSFAPASKCFPTIAASMSKNSAAARDGIISPKEPVTTLNFSDSNVGFCPASKLLPNHVSDMATTCDEQRSMKKKRDSTPVSMELERTTSRSSPGGALPDSTSEQNVVTIDLTDLTSEESKADPGVGGGGGGVGKKEPPMTTKSTGRKRKIDQAVAKTKKITYFFEK